MTLVEWTRLEGGQVEAGVAMLINREHPHSVRITPSRGDGGVDILDRRSGPDGSDVVYQVKRYTDPLTPKQKTEVENSLSTLIGDTRWDDLEVVEWHLVMPWDPTPEAENWLQGVGREHGLTPIWHGLVHVEQLAAKYPDVVDYYLHGGRTRIEEAHAQVAALFGADRIEQGLTVPEVTKRVEKALETLNHDPHYRFEHHFGQGDPPQPPTDRSGVVMHWMTHDAKNGRWILVDVIPQCAASMAERPIRVEGAIVVPPDSDFGKVYEDFLTYGVPFTSPEGAYHGELDAPGGLGGPFKDGTVTVLPPTVADLGDDPELRLEVLDPSGDVLAAVDVDRTGRSQGVKGGLRIVHEEPHGIFALEHRFNLAEHRATRTLRFGDVIGRPVAVALPAIAFVAHLQAPNRLRTGPRHAPPGRGVVDPEIGFPFDEDLRGYVRAMVRALETLSILQTHTATVIRVPDFTKLPPDQTKSWHFAAALLRGEEVVGTYPEGHAVVIELAAEITPPAEGPFSVAIPLATRVGDQTIDLGHYEAMLDDPQLVDRHEADGRVHHLFTTPDRTIRHRLHQPDETA